MSALPKAEEVAGAELVTVLVPSRNERRTIAACLGSILDQHYGNLQVVVVDGASTDGTPAIVAGIAAEDPRVELVTEPRPSIPAALNTGLAAARGTWLVRVDAHSTVPPDYVGLAVERLREGRWGGVGGRKDGVGESAAAGAIAAAMGSRFGVGNSIYHHGTAATQVDHIPFGAYPAALLRAVGGWDERLTANEDYELDYRLRRSGHQLLFDPALEIRWESRQRVRDLARQYYRYGRGKADVAALHPASLSPRHLAPPAFVAYAGAALGVAAVRPARGLAMLAPYAAALAAASALAARRLEQPRERAQVPLAFLAMHLPWGAGFLARVPRALALRRARRWPAVPGASP